MAKFKCGQRVRCIKPIKNLKSGKRIAPAGEMGVVTGLPGCVAQSPDRYRVKFDAFPGDKTGVKEHNLRALLPDADTYHPADISIDDLMRGLRETEYV